MYPRVQSHDKIQTYDFCFVDVLPAIPPALTSFLMNSTTEISLNWSKTSMKVSKTWNRLNETRLLEKA